MTTPSPQPSGVSLGNGGPPGSFLQQLLDEIHGRGTSRILRTGSAPQATPNSQPGSHASSRRASPVWVGGTSIAQEAREKLRALDEARLYKTSTHGTRGTPDDYKLSPRLHISPIRPASSPSDRRVQRLSNSKPDVSGSFREILCRQRMRGANSGGVEAPCLSPTVGGMGLPSSNFIAQTLWSSNDAAEAETPLTFCNIDSDVSSTPPPTEAPTSPVTAASTEATVVSDGPSSSRDTSRDSSPRKRARSRHCSRKMLSKKMRSMTLPETESITVTSSEATTFSSFRAIGSDNRWRIRTPTFVERAPASSGTISPIELHALPELSSFRPGIGSPPGPPQPSTPVRTSTRRASMLEQDQSPTPAETPRFARPLHLIDTDISLYKHDHGEEWKENPLCLCCFRKHGSFNRILTHGYEVCGREEMLDSHYWEPALNPYT